MYPAVLLKYFICAAVILLASLALIVHVSLPYNKTGRASVNKLIHRLRVATLPLGLLYSGPVAHSGEISTTGKSHGKKLDRFSINDDMDGSSSRQPYSVSIVFQTSLIKSYAESQLTDQIFVRINKGDLLVSCISVCVSTTLHHLSLVSYILYCKFLKLCGSGSLMSAICHTLT